MVRYIVERVDGRFRDIVGTVVAKNRAACYSLPYASLPGTDLATTAIRTEQGETEHAYNNQHFEFRSLLRATKRDRRLAIDAGAF